MNTENFLLELGCEELPPKLLKQLSQNLTKNLSAQLSAANLTYAQVESFATPRRLAVLVHGLQTQQADQNIARKGPAVGAPEQAVLGFAKSCGVAIADLQQKSLAKADYYYFTQQKKGRKTADLLAEIVDISIKKIPIAKPMRWGTSDFSFVRPVHWLVMLLGTEVIAAVVMGLKSGNTTRGLRFTGAPTFDIIDALDYRKTLLDEATIEVDFVARKALIRTQVQQVAADNNANAIIDDALLDEVCALVECPLAFFGKFDAKFLAIPTEALISAMKLHQKYFHLVDNNGQLLPAFIAVANIHSKDLAVIISGNERVIRPRLSDAEFFWTQDKAANLESRLHKLGDVLFMKNLGSMADKAKRIAQLSQYIAEQIGANNVEDCARAGLLCKSDLVTDMVGEFADLQGIMGGYYARNDGESDAVARAISAHYHPRFSGDSLPDTEAGLLVAIADKVDSIVGIIGVGHQPTGSKDPYALKRAGLGLLRIIIESKLELDLLDLLFKSAELHRFDTKIAAKVYDFILERLDAYYQDKGIDKAVVKAVVSVRKDSKVANNFIYDWHLRIQALNVFMQNENAQSLVEANKRIKNILKDIDPKTYATDASSLEIIRAKATEFDKNLHQSIGNISADNDYEKTINALLSLKPVIDDFFENVMINDENLELRKLRFNLINAVRMLFLKVADFAVLSK